ncbi:MAG: alpha/beta fold hydrolase [Sedimentibacter sp.]
MKKLLILILCVFLTLSTSCKKSEKVIIDNSYFEKTGTSYLSDLVNKKYDDAYTKYPHDSAMQNAVNPEKYAAIFNDVNKTYGDFVNFSGSDISLKGDYTIFTMGVIYKAGSLNANVVFDKNGNISGLNFSAYTFNESILPNGITETDITFGSVDWPLTAKLTKPEADGKYPLLILVHGSGPNDMNETVGMNQPFKDIAYSLAQKGVAVLRYDKRTFTYMNKLTDLTNFTVYDETIDDAVEAVNYVKDLDFVDNTKIYILGHSLGGYLIPRIAELTSDAAGYIIASGIFTSLGDIIPYQIEYLSNLDGVITEEEKIQIEEYKASAAKSLNPDLIGDDEIVMGAYKSYWEDLYNYKPIELAKEIKKPVFVLQGDRDYQVPVAQYDMIYEAFKNNDNFTFKLYPGLNHLLIFGTEKSTPQEYSVKGNVSEVLIEDMANFVK